MWTCENPSLHCGQAWPRRSRPASSVFSTPWRSMERAFLFTVFAASLSWAADAVAGLSLTVPSATFYTNEGTATLDVVVTGDGSTAFGGFTLSFAITPDASNATAPLEPFELATPSSAAALGPTLPQSARYIFYGNSLDVGPPASPFVSALGGGNTLLTVADSTADFSDVTLGNGASALLAELVFNVPTNITNSVGDKFDITLSDPNVSPTALQSNNTGDVPVSGTFMGVVTVEAPNVSPVPEPGTFGMLLAGMTGMLWMNRRRCRPSLADEHCKAPAS